jgi:hypothetical protein
MHHVQHVQALAHALVLRHKYVAHVVDADLSRTIKVSLPWRPPAEHAVVTEKLLSIPAAHVRDVELNADLVKSMFEFLQV